MKKIIFRKTILPIFLATAWIMTVEFIRNEVLFKSLWVEHYASLGLVFPSDPITGAVWGLWSFLFAALIFIISERFDLIETTVFAWFAGFVLMWAVIGNLGVMPPRLLYGALPMSIFETFFAALIIRKSSGKTH